MKREILNFLKRERDALADDLKRFQQGERRIISINGGQQDITPSVIAETEARLLRFEELIAASESKLT